jgi:hypothetical protein
MQTPMMSFEMRVALLIFNGVQAWPGGRDLALYTDAVTGSTFAIEPGQTVGQGLAAFIVRWQALSEPERAQAQEPALALGDRRDA